MLGPVVINTVPIQIAQLMRGLQDWSINRIANMIRKSGMQITSSAEYLLTTLRERDIFDIDLKKKLQQILGISDTAINNMFQQAAEANYLYDKRMFIDKGISFTPFRENMFMQDLTRNIIDQTKGELYNITRSMGFAEDRPTGRVFKPMAKYYQDELDLATMKVTTGVQTLDGALKEAVRKMADSGMRTVDYATGHTDRIDVAARRAVMGAMRDLTNRQSEYNAQLLGSTVYEIEWHGGHRPSHAWGGRRFDTSGKLYPTEQELYEKYTSPDGVTGTLDDYNCYHIKYAVDPESPPTFTDKQLAEMEEAERTAKEYVDEEAKKATEAAGKEYVGKEYTPYEARQQQRYLERVTRRYKSLIAGAEGALDGAPEGELPEMEKALQNFKTKKRGLDKQYREFSKAMGLPKERERINTGFVA